MSNKLTFWEWIVDTYGHFDHYVVTKIVGLLKIEKIPNGSNPQTYEDVKDVLMPLGFDREELKKVQNLWSEFLKSTK